MSEDSLKCAYCGKGEGFYQHAPYDENCHEFLADQRKDQPMTETTTQVERVARAIMLADAEAIENEVEPTSQNWATILATAAIKAMSDAEPVAGQVERSAVVAWLKKEAVDCRAAMTMAPESDMASLYLMRAGYYEQAAGMIGRGAHHAPPQPHTAPIPNEVAPQGRDEVERLREALAWYGEQARLARLIHGEGDAGRNALADDGGSRARAALSPPLS